MLSFLDNNEQTLKKIHLSRKNKVYNDNTNSFKEEIIL